LKQQAAMLKQPETADTVLHHSETTGGHTETVGDGGHGVALL
jgi:hypothetical protein